jgi:hypothetical protein
MPSVGSSKQYAQVLSIAGNLVSGGTTVYLCGKEHQGQRMQREISSVLSFGASSKKVRKWMEGFSYLVTTRKSADRIMKKKQP